jgi:hypothetical protein
MISIPSFTVKGPFTDKARILNFLIGVSPDYRNRMFKDMLLLSDYDLEKCHDQIQWMFPLHEESNHADVYPILTKDVTDAAKDDPTVIGNMLLAKRRMEQFYGLQPKNEEKQKSWCRDRNHNLLRVTRIIRSLRLFGLEDEAQAFYDKVFKVGYRVCINVTTLRFWEKAMKDDIWETLQ